MSIPRTAIVFLLGLSVVAGLPSFSRAQAPCGTCDEEPLTTAQQDGLTDSDSERAQHLWRAARRAWHDKDWEGATSFSNELIARFPGTGWEARGRSLKGLHLKFSGEWDAAVLEFKRIIALDAPKRLRHDIMTSLACILLNRGSFDEAFRLVGQVESETTDWDQKKFCRAWAREIRRRQELQQHTRLESCGPKSLAYVLKEGGRPVTPDELAAALSPHEQDIQVSVGVLRDAARKLGVATEAVEIAAADLVDIDLPAIGLVKPGHFVVIRGASEDRIDVYDPDNGSASYTRERFGQIWQGVALVFGESAQREPQLLAEDKLATLFGGVCDCCPLPTMGTTPNDALVGPPAPGCAGVPSFQFNSTNLNLLVQDVDLRYQPLLGPEVEFKRTYNNDASTEGVFGRGWTHSYAWQVLEFPTQAQVVRGDGRIDVYTALGGGAYDGPLGVNDRLLELPDGTFTLDLWQEKLLYRFATDGLLDRIEDRNRNAIALTYEDNRPSDFGGSSAEPGYVRSPQGLVADAAGNLYLADSANNRVQKFSPTGSWLLAWGSYGSGHGQFKSPRDVALDAEGNVYVADAGNYRIEKFDAAGVWLGGWGSYGSGTGQFRSVDGVAIDANGAVYVTDSTSNRVQKFDAGGTFILTWGSSGSSAGRFASPDGIEVSAGSVYVADSSNHRIQRFTLEGTYVGQWGSNGTQDGRFNFPSAIAADSLGFLYVTDKSNHRVQKFDALGVFQSRWGVRGSEPGNFSSPQGIAVNSSVAPAEVVVADTENNRIERFDAAGVFIASFAQGGFVRPAGLTVDTQGNRYVADSGNNRIQKFNAAGDLLKTWGHYGMGSGNDEMVTPWALAYDAASEVLYVAEQQRIKKYTPEGVLIANLNLSGGGRPGRIAFFDGRLYVVNTTTSRIQEYNAHGDFLAEWGGAGGGDGQFTSPIGIAVDQGGYIYVADSLRVQRFDPQRQFLHAWAMTGTVFIATGADGALYVTRSNEVVRYRADGTFLARWSSTEAGASWVSLAGIVRFDDGTIDVVDYGQGRVARFSGALPLGRVLTGITDATGGHITLTYDAHCRVSDLEDPSGHHATFDYPRGLYLESSTDMDEVTSSFAYNPATYDLQGIVVKRREGEIEEVLSTWGFGYSGSSPAWWEDPNGHRIPIAHSYSANSVTDPEGRQTQYTYGWGGTTKIRKYYGGQLLTNRSFTYDPEGNRNGMTDPENHATSWVVDGRGRTRSYTDAEAQTTTWDYDDQNFKVTMIGPAHLSSTTVYQYDQNENLRFITDARTKVTEMQYFADGRLSSVTTPMNKTTTYEYDDIARKTTITDAAQNVTILTFDALGRLVGRQNPPLPETTYGYDALGRRLWERHPDGTTRRWEYYCCGALEAETDEMDRRTEYERDGTRQITSVSFKPHLNSSADDILVASYDYYDSGLPLWMKDVFLRQTIYDHDERGWLKKRTYPDGTWEDFTYYKDGHLATRTDRRRRTTSYAYDKNGRTTIRTFPDGSSEEFGYDEAGRMTTAKTKDAAGLVLTSLTHSYLPTGQVETTTTTSFGATKFFRLNYLDDGKLEWWQDESGIPYRTTHLGYFDNGWLQSIVGPDSDLYEFEYQDDGLLKKKSYPNGTWTDYAYEPNRRWLTALRHRRTTDESGIMAQFVYADSNGVPWYDAVGNRTQVDMVGGEHIDMFYDFNRMDRLLDADRAGTSNDEHYSYDDMGNRLTSQQYVDWSYDPLNDELDAGASASYTYDDNGNRATKTDNTGTTTYTYDYDNRLVRVDLPGGTWVIYDYDALGRRVRKSSNGTVTLFWYLDEDIVLETDAAGTEVARYVHGPGIDSPLSVKVNGGTYYYHEDPLGSIVLMTDASGNPSRTYKYDAFGNVYSQTGSVPNFYQYTGREWDAESALYYYRARHYDPKAGRFLQGDSIPPRPEEMNAYVYVSNNPVNLKDSFGEAIFKNRSKVPIPYKPENEDNVTRVCPPGGWCNVDGVYSPPGTPPDKCNILKIPDNCVGWVGDDGKVKSSCLLPNIDKPCIVTRDTLRQDNFKNWPNPYTGDYWPFSKWN